MIELDINEGLIPFWYGASLGTTSTGSFEPIAEITKISKKHGVFVAVDAAYAGSALICKEYKYLSEQLKDVDFFVVNFNKWLLSGYNASLLFVRNRFDYISAFTGEEAEFLKKASHS